MADYPVAPSPASIVGPSWDNRCMKIASRLGAVLAVFLSLCGMAAHAEKKTICTITVNSPDEKETFRARLPKGDYEFVELVEKGRPDWLRSSCQKGIQCDMLVVSGHFNAGDTFYSDQLDRNEYLDVDELERASCSASCPNLFSRLKEVYLFGCESLNPDASKYASSHGESGRDRMRRIFPDVPSIYGFYSSAPVGPTAAMLLNRYFDGGGGARLGSGQLDAKLLKVFGKNHMTHARGVREGEQLATYRGQVCQFFDERKSTSQKMAVARRVLADPVELRTHFTRVEKLLLGFTDEERKTPEFSEALARISADDETRGRFLAHARRVDDPATRSRMLAVAMNLGWLSPEQQRTEHVALVNDLLARPALGFAEVDLVCKLNDDRHLDGGLQQVKAGGSTNRIGHAATLACLGDRNAHAQVLRALASSDDREVQVAQAYLRHRPVERAELRQLARDVTQMQGPAQVRAFDALARLNISDREILDDLSRAFAEARSVGVQRAIAEVFVRADAKSLPRRELAAVVRQHRIKSREGGQDLVDVLLSKLGDS